METSNHQQIVLNFDLHIHLDEEVISFEDLLDRYVDSCDKKQLERQRVINYLESLKNHFERNA